MCILTDFKKWVVLFFYSPFTCDNIENGIIENGLAIFKDIHFFRTPKIIKNYYKNNFQLNFEG